MSDIFSKMNGKNLSKVAFALVASKKQVFDDSGIQTTSWHCCDTIYGNKKDIHQHLSFKHKADVRKLELELKKNIQVAAVEGVAHTKCSCIEDLNITGLTDIGKFEHLHEELSGVNTKWLPSVENEHQSSEDEIIILFYCYRAVPCTNHTYCWQKELCERLSLTGKVRVSTEGLNVTVGGTRDNVDKYIRSVQDHPWFNMLRDQDFKRSVGKSGDFPAGLKVGIYQELVPMGVDPDKVSFKDAAQHLSPEAFHKELTDMATGKLADETVVIDCRNFYESKIGHFEGALCPDIRKFSYWPDYIRQNPEVFEDKRVLMYCTGGIRCERGSAYLKAQGLCKEIYQLEGGIHKYLDQYPDGHFRGKMYVFDERYAISPTDETISGCSYCGKPWDKYAPCTQLHCHQLVLSCDSCRTLDLTTCCAECKENRSGREECICTRQRPRIPVDQTGSGHQQESVKTQALHETSPETEGVKERNTVLRTKLIDDS